MVQTVYRLQKWRFFPRLRCMPGCCVCGLRSGAALWVWSYLWQLYSFMWYAISGVSWKSVLWGVEGGWMLCVGCKWATSFVKDGVGRVAD